MSVYQFISSNNTVSIIRYL